MNVKVGIERRAVIVFGMLSVRAIVIVRTAGVLRGIVVGREILGIVMIKMELWEHSDVWGLFGQGILLGESVRL